MMQPGDWLCPNQACRNAQNGVFAKHSSCPKCGSLKGAPSRGTSGLSPWTSGTLSSPRGGQIQGSSPGPQEGDWQCPNQNCINHDKMVFGKHESCPKCGSLKMANGGGEARPGDWKCPNPACVNHANGVFGKHDSCRKCGCPRPGRGAPAPSMIYQPPGRGFQVQRMMPAMAPGARDGDWMCPNMDCVNNRRMVFGKHDSCPACGTMRGAKKAGDWQCPNLECKNHRNGVFGKYSECPACGEAKPTPLLSGGGGRNRSRSPRGHGY